MDFNLNNGVFQNLQNENSEKINSENLDEKV